MKIIAVVLSVLVLISCENNSSKLTQTEDGNYVVNIDPSKIVTVNMSDANGKQGRWQDDDTVNHRILRKYYYVNDLLDGPFLEYKIASSDTLILGNYKSGNKQGEWKYWSANKNSIERIEIYENGVLKETRH
jgi:antitoxin component YwqK of YwqJK toxin-antitoxin module